MSPEERVEKAFTDWLRTAMRERTVADWHGKAAPEVTVTDTQLKALLADAIRQAVAEAVAELGEINDGLLADKELEADR